MQSRRDRLTIEAPIERCFDLVRSVEFHLHAARSIAATVERGRRCGLAELGDEIGWSARYWGLRFRLTTRVTALDRPNSYEETAITGPFREFGHRYRLAPTADGTLVEDTFSFCAPFGPLGRLAETVLIRPALWRAQDERLRELATAAETDAWRAFVGG